MELLVPAVAGPFTTSLHFTSPPLPAAAKTLLIPSKSAVSLKITRLTPVARASNDARSGRMLLLSTHASSSPGGTASSSAPPSFLLSPGSQWIVVTEKPPNGLSSKSEVIDYYVSVLTRVLGSEREAQMCIYDASWQSRSHFGFCCDIDEDAALQLAKLPGVLSVRRDRDPESSNKDYSFSSSLLTQLSRSDGCPSKFTHAPGVNSNYWLVQMEKPGVEVVTKAQMVDYYAQTLTKVLGNEKDAQASIYNISWEKEFGFCCHIDENCAAALADVPGVLSVRPDLNFDSENKDYRGSLTPEKEADLDSSNASQSPSIKTKRLFVTGLSFYTSEKTLRAAFEGYGELVEVKVIMDKISKRSKGYAFIEYTTEEAASAALKEMNGKIINGWMIVVDVAKTNPPRYSRGRPRPSASRVSSN